MAALAHISTQYYTRLEQARGPTVDVPDHILDLIERIPDTAAMVLDAKYDVLAWTSSTSAVPIVTVTSDIPICTVRHGFHLQ